MLTKIFLIIALHKLADLVVEFFDLELVLFKRRAITVVLVFYRLFILRQTEIDCLIKILVLLQNHWPPGWDNYRVVSLPTTQLHPQTQQKAHNKEHLVL